MATKTISVNDLPAPESHRSKFNPLPDDVQAALEHLIRTAEAKKICIAGFAFCAEPINITNFGNVSDCGDPKLFQLLLEFSETQRKAGMVVTAKVLPIQ